MAPKQNSGNKKSTSTKPKAGTPKDGRLSENRSSAYKGGAATKAKGAPTNSHKPGTQIRKD
jgi:hypothetical protein